MEAHAAVAALHIPQETIDAVLEDWTTAEIPEKTRAALKLLEYMTVHPQDIDLELITELRTIGLDNLAIQEAANVGFHYNLIDRVADAFDLAQVLRFLVMKNLPLGFEPAGEGTARSTAS